MGRQICFEVEIKKIDYFAANPGMIFQGRGGAGVQVTYSLRKVGYWKNG